MKLHALLHQALYSVRAPEAFAYLIEIAANLKAGRPLEELRCARFLEAGGELHILEGAAKALLEADVQARFDAVNAFFDQLTSDMSRTPWIRAEASDQLIALVDGGMNVRFSYSAAVRPCLTYAYRMMVAGKAPHIKFCSPNADESDFVQDLAEVLDLRDVISAETAWPWARTATSEAGVEVMLPPLNVIADQSERIPPRTLATLGLEEGQRGRINMEGLSIADTLENTRGRAIILVTGGELSRMVGAEPVVRRNLLDSGRLEAVMSAPPGMMFSNTLIKTNIVVVSSSLNTRETVRFADLGHATVARKGRRGRYEIVDGASWLSILEGDELEDEKLARDVIREEIIENNTVLLPERYLNTSAREQVDALLEKSDVAPLEEIVELVRPVTISGDRGGEYTLHEASPGDVNDRGFVREPSRAVTVGRAKYNRASNQQLRPGDVLLGIKGNVGVVAMVPGDVPGEGENNIWTAGQSMMILRPKKRIKMSSLALYEYLSNATVQKFIRSLASGTTILTLAMKDLKGFPVPMPDDATISRIEAGFAERQAIFDQIEDKRKKLKDVRDQHWPHDLLNHANSANTS